MSIQICYEKGKITYVTGGKTYTNMEEAIRNDRDGKAEISWKGVCPVDVFLEMQKMQNQIESKSNRLERECKKPRMNCGHCSMLCEQ